MNDLADREILHPQARVRGTRLESGPTSLAGLFRALVLLAPLLLGACATRFDPEAAGGLTPLREVGFIQRALVRHNEPLTVKVSALSGEESLAAFGVPLADDGIQTVQSSLFRSQYRYSPVSPLYLFERSQDIALQKARASVDERNHLRLWMSPYRYRGMHVFVGQISRDIGVRFSSKTFVTHKIDPDGDEARDYLSQDLIKSGGSSRFRSKMTPTNPAKEPKRT